jgi:hypothetical protein
MFNDNSGEIEKLLINTNIDVVSNQQTQFFAMDIFLLVVPLNNEIGYFMCMINMIVLSLTQFVDHLRTIYTNYCNSLYRG